MTHLQLLDEAVARHNDAEWSRHALELIRNDQRRSADTHLLRLDLPVLEGIDVYLKDESTHPTGSLKHRLARSLFLYGICNGRIRQDTPIVEASSGSTAISEAYFARLLGLPFHAVMAASTSAESLAPATAGTFKKWAEPPWFRQTVTLGTTESAVAMV